MTLPTTMSRRAFFGGLALATLSANSVYAHSRPHNHKASAHPRAKTRHALCKALERLDNLRPRSVKSFSQPLFDDCVRNNLFLIYHVASRQLTYRGDVIAMGHAGNDYDQKTNPHHVHGLDNPEKENFAYIGPLPHGEYVIGDPRLSCFMGADALPLFPSPENNMYGRDKMFIHAVEKGWTHGCLGLSAFDRDKVVALWRKGVRALRVEPS